MLPLSLGHAKTILCLGAHPDDIEIGCGGTLLTLLKETAATVHWHVFSGTATRRDEAQRTARSFVENASHHRVEVQSFRDSYFPEQWSDIKQYISGLRDCDPDVVFTHFQQDRHQDHRVIAELTHCVFRDHLVLEYEIPKYDGDLVSPNVLFALGRETCEAKVNAIMSGFPSQCEKHWFSEELFFGLLRIRGAEIASTYAEGFHVRKALLTATH